MNLTFNGKKLTLETEATLKTAFIPCVGEWLGTVCKDNQKMYSYYEALAIDEFGEKYRVIWAPFEGYEVRDEEDACNWAHPTSIIAI